MQSNIRNIKDNEINLVKQLATISKPNRIAFSQQMLDLFVSPYSNQRQIIGYFDSSKLIASIGIRDVVTSPAYILQWMIGKNMTKSIATNLLNAVLLKYESDFYIPTPIHMQAAYIALLKPLQNNFWIFTEYTVPSHSRSNYSLYWNILGYQSYPFDMNINRCIRKR